MSEGRAAKMFQVDQVLIMTGMGGAELGEDFGNGAEDTKLYALKVSGEDYDLKAAGVEDHKRKVAVVLDGLELVVLIRNLINLLIDAGEEGLMIQDILRDMVRRQAKGGQLN